MNGRNRATTYLLVLREQYRRDFIRYAAEQLWIQTKRPGEIILLDVTRKPLQRMVVAAAYRQIKDLGYVDGNIVKGRQQGSSTVCQAFHFWKASLNRNYNTLLIAQDKPTTRVIFEKARFFYEHLHPSIKPQIRASNRDEVVFAHPEHKSREIADYGLGSRMDFLNAENMLAGTGSTRQGLLLSECAKFNDEDIEVLLSSLYPCMLQGEGTIRIKEATPFVGGKWFRECCDAARAGQVDEFFVFCPFYLEPDYQRPLDPEYDKKLARMVGLDAEERRIVKLAKAGQPKDRVPPFEIRPEQLKWRRWMLTQPGFDENIFLEEYPCIVAGTRVGTQRGVIPIEEVKAGDQTSGGQVFASVAKGIKPIWRAVTERGYSVRGTDTHPLATSAGSYVRLAQSIGSDIRLQAPSFALRPYILAWRGEFGVEHKLEVDRDFARFLGYLMGDGCFMPYRSHDGLRPKGTISTLFAKYLGRAVTPRVVGSKGGGREIRAGSGTFFALAQRLGIYRELKPHRTVRVPEAIWRSPKPVIAEFLRGLFEANGSRTSRSRHIVLFSKHREFLENVQLLLLGFGIECAVAPQQKQTRAMTYHGYKLDLRTFAGDRFLREIGFVGQRKQHAFDPPGKRGRNAIAQTGTDKIVSVEALNYSAPVWDLTVGEDHVFDANGLRVHNSDYDSAWISFDKRAFNHQKLYEIRDRDIRQPSRMIQVLPGPTIIDDHNARMQADVNYTAVWEEPKPGEDYDLGADVAAGIEGGDWSTGTVFKRRNREQVAEVHVHLDPADFGTLLFWLGVWYNSAHLAVEWQGGYGVATEGQLKRMNYPNLALWMHRDQVVPMPTKKTGWQTTPESKAYMIAGIFRTFVNHDRVTIRSRILLNEMFAYIQIPYGSHYDYRAGEGKDDLVIAAGITLVIGDDESQAGISEAQVKTAVVSSESDLALVDKFDPHQLLAPSPLLKEIRGTGEQL